MNQTSHPNVSTRLFDAMELAFRLHGRDVRKSTDIPVMTHLLSVCGLVLHDGGDEDEAIGALLHDAIEDKPEQIGISDIREQFGERVVAIVEISSDTPPGHKGGPKPPWRDRKEAYLEHVKRSDPSLLRVTVADKVDNVRAILADYGRVGESLWSRFNAGKEDQLWYYQAAASAYRSAGFETDLLLELEELVGGLKLVVIK
jgi:(p)ppGpp synthase/HD superfamily hydrolase